MNKYLKLQNLLLLIATLLSSVFANLLMMSKMFEVDINRWVVLVFLVEAILFILYLYLKDEGVKSARIVLLAPIILLIPFMGIGNLYNGLIGLINIFILKYNAFNHEGIRLINIATNNEQHIKAFVFIFVCAFLLVVKALINKRKYILILIEIILIILSLKVDSLTSMALVFVLLGFVTFEVNRRNLGISFANLIVLALVLFSLLLTQYKASNDGSYVLKRLRETSIEVVNNIRYGKDLLPRGDLKKANKLNESSEELFTISSKEVKNIYLRAFVGDELQDNKWKSLDNSNYGYDNTGMLEYLKDNDFDPLRQVSKYYELSNKELFVNDVQISVTNGNRYNLYLPISLFDMDEPIYKTLKDQRYVSNGIIGASNYSYTEISSNKPNELLINEDWLLSPDSEEQRQYIDNEAIYRQFVYENYTNCSSDLYGDLNRIFWNLEIENDSIYQSVEHIRDVLSLNYQYDENYFEGNESPIISFLNDSKKGNSMLFASVGVEALKAHGIPARYIEGYYISNGDFKNDSPKAVTSKNAHCWAEVYFDGVGWLPIDFTPNYYYDTLSLQNMVSMPNDIKLTAALEDTDFKGNKVESGAQTTSNFKTLPDIIIETSRILLGLIGIVVVLLTFIFALFEIIRFVKISKINRIFKGANLKSKAFLVNSLIYTMLRFLNIDSSLGFKDEEIDKLLVKDYNFENQEFNRVCKILEKSIYGGIELMPFEERTIIALLKKLYATGLKDKWNIRIRFHFLLLGIKSSV